MRKVGIGGVLKGQWLWRMGAGQEERAGGEVGGWMW